MIKECFYIQVAGYPVIVQYESAQFGFDNLAHFDMRGGLSRTGYRSHFFDARFLDEYGGNYIEYARVVCGEFFEKEYLGLSINAVDAILSEAASKIDLMKLPTINLLTYIHLL